MESRSDLHARHHYALRYCRLVAYAAVMLFAVPAFALDIPEVCRVRNIGGRCAWSCLQTAANVLGERRLFGLVNRRGGLRKDAYQTNDLGSVDKVGEQLASLKVSHLIEPDGTYNYDTLRKYAKSRGVMVTLFKDSAWLNGRKLQMAHAVLITDYDDKQGVKFYCPDNPQQIWHGPIEWYKASWSGSAVVILEEQQ